MGYQADITRAVKTVIGNLAGFTGVTIRRQKRPFFSADHGHTLPFCSVVPQAEKPALLVQKVKGILVDYPVLVVLLQTRGATVESEAELDWQTDRRQELMEALWQSTLAGAAQVMDCSYDPHPVFDLGGLDRHFDVSAQLFTFRNSQTRDG